MLPSLVISIFRPPSWPVISFEAASCRPQLLLCEEHVTYLPPVMSTISRDLLARPEESLVVTVAFLDKRSLFTAVMMHML